VLKENADMMERCTRMKEERSLTTPGSDWKNDLFGEIYKR
jgi:hypothetical protein